MSDNFEEKQKQLYKEFQPIFCPAMQETVYFNSAGLHHLLFKDKRGRSSSERRYRLSLLPYIHEVISKAINLASRVKSKNPLVKTWSMSHSITEKDAAPRIFTVVVIRKKPNGRLYFLSVMDK
jgi:hypothetical protein